MKKQEFLVQATLNVLIGSAGSGGAYAVWCAETAWGRLQEIAELDAARTRAAAKTAAEQVEDRV